ncbi:MAG: RelA/SpoT family protein [Gammaproteobacteria bacterium]
MNRLLISELCSFLETYLEPDQIPLVYDAYLFGAEHHEGQTRRSGEPYIYHPVTVAKILAEMHMDRDTIVAAILHDVVEDTDATVEMVAERFGESVAELVDGVSKLTHAQHARSRQEKQAANFLKMLMAMSKDIRVIIIKLCDRLHNMRTLGAMPTEKKARIARETLDIYAPIANRLGMNSVRLELEDLSFAALCPWRFKVLSTAVKRRRGNRKEILSKVETNIQNALDDEGIRARIRCREKHIYGIYKKMQQKDLPFRDVFDVYAVRLVVERVDTCYRCLGVMHNLYNPVPGRFKDYIAIPKANGYQSLHTILFGPHGVPMEVQIRTFEMDGVAESGIAAHWVYKSGDEERGNAAHVRARRWLTELLEIQKSAGNSVEFLEHVKVDLFPQEVYVFTPMGEILTLPRGATVVDFAFAVHTDVGNSAVAAKIDRRLVPMNTELLNGQTVEVITAPGATPSPAWLSFVVSSKARATIRHRLKQLKKDEAERFGRRLIDRELAADNARLDDFDPGIVAEILERYGLEDIDALCADVGLGNRAPAVVARALLGATSSEDDPDEDGRPQALMISGSEGMVVQFARCCRPIPGDPIVGYSSAGRGLVVHHRDCTNISGNRGDQAQWIDVQWSPDTEGEYPVEIRINVANRRGVLATIAGDLAEQGCNIEDVHMEERDGKSSSLDFIITVPDRINLARIMKRLRRNRDVLKLHRVGVKRRAPAGEPDGSEGQAN